MSPLPFVSPVVDSNEYLSSDEENVPTRRRAPYAAAEYAPKDLNDDSNSVSNCDVRRPAATAAVLSGKKVDLEMEKLCHKTSSSASTSAGNSSSSGHSSNMSSNIRSSGGVKASLSVYNFIEELRMQELHMACDLLRPWCRYNKVVHEMLQVNQMYDAVEQIINKVIEMSRLVTTFKDLCEMEQMTLLKGAVTEMIILRSVLNYMPDKDSWVFNLLSVSNSLTNHLDV